MLDITDASLQTGSTLNVEVRKLQRFLNDQGFNAGPVDGIFGSMTRGALVRFQVAAEIPTTGAWGRDDAAAAISYTSGEDPQEVAWGDVRTGILGPIVVSVDQDESAGDAGDACSLLWPATHSLPRNYRVPAKQCWLTACQRSFS